MASPYAGKPITEWADITRALIAAHPLQPDVILDAAQTSWARLWGTTVGDATLGFPFAEADPPATVVGYFFEKLFAKELAARFPKIWRGGKGSEKDLHCLTDLAKSVEMKASGQLGYRVYGNRSYGQQVENTDAAKKDKSGYYITINFHGQILTLLRFGWIDAEDWQAQKSATGQMAGLGDDVYKYKLLPIPGPYVLDGPVQLVDGVGPKAAQELVAAGLTTIRQLVTANNVSDRYAKLQAAARKRYEGSY
ncbi:ScaI family restriction endonuclease [Ralstonia nicotianae]